jgi:signal transduction histidine kinase
MKYFFLIVLCILKVDLFFSQATNKNILLHDSIRTLIKNRNLNEAHLSINKYRNVPYKINDRYLVIDENEFYYYYLKKKYDSCYKIINNVDSYKKKLTIGNLNQFYTIKAYLFKATNQLDSSSVYLIKSLKYFEIDSTKNIYKRVISYQGLANIYRVTNNKIKQLKYLNLYLKEALKTKNDYQIGTALNGLGVYYDNLNEPKKALVLFKRALKYKLRDNVYNSINQNIGSIYLNHLNNIDSSYYYNKRAVNKKASKRTLAFVYRDLAVIANRKKNYFIENKELLKSLKSIKLDPFPELEIELYKHLSENNKRLQNYKKSLFYLEKYDSLNSIVRNQSLIEKVEEIETKFQTEKKEKENLKLKSTNIETEAKRVQNRNLLIGSLLFIILTSSIGFLSLKNSKRKRKLAEQEKELESQKNLTLLKEQELTTINAMVEGQEKERKRVAEDLHDNLGSVLATIKLHFENLQINNQKKKINQDELFNKTENLIDEAYLKVRSIAHAKNAGVIANQGLLTAVQMMAEKISSADKINIEVIDYGLDKRLENSLEITIFRIVQELITNVIKHAEAKNAAINISSFDNNLNIIIEDDGKGFDLKKVDLKNGMGISSIKTRVKHLNGTFEIDSTLKKGTSVIINIPIT